MSELKGKCTRKFGRLTVLGASTGHPPFLVKRRFGQGYKVSRLVDGHFDISASFVEGGPGFFADDPAGIDWCVPVVGLSSTPSPPRIGLSIDGPGGLPRPVVGGPDAQIAD